MDGIDVMAREDWRERLREIIERSGASPRQVSMMAGFSQTALRDILNGKAKFPRMSTIERVSTILGVTPEEFGFSYEMSSDYQRRIANQSTGKAPAVNIAAIMRHKTPSNAAQYYTPRSVVEHIVNAVSEDVGNTVIPREALVGEADLPVYASAQGGAGEILLSFDAIEYVRRPEPLMKVKGGFGIYVTGDSMAPAYEPGDTALIHPHKPCVADDDVLVILTDGNGTQRALLKRLVKRDDDAVTLKQWNPGRVFDVPAEEVHGIYRVVGKYSRR